MHNRIMGSYDEIPDGMKRYVNNYGYHFNKKLYDEATSRMYRKVNGKKESVRPYTKEQVEALMESYNIELERDKLCDAMYVATMCRADFLGRSVPTDEHLAKYVKDVIDDPDADEGYVFMRFYSDCVFMDNPIDWDEMI